MFKKIIEIFLIVLILGTVISNYVWIKGNSSIAGVDSPNHLFFSIEFFYDLSDLLQNQARGILGKLQDFLNLFSEPVRFSSVCWPNFVFFTTSIFYFFLEKSLFIAKLSMFFYYFILIFSVYFMSRRIMGNSGSILAVFLISVYPLIFESSRQYGLDFPLTAWTAFSMFLMVKTNYFKNMKYSFILGVVVGIGMLVKSQLVVFIFLPLIYMLYKIIKYNFEKDKDNFFLKYSSVINFIIFIGLTFSIALIWWGNPHNYQTAVVILKEHILDPYNWMKQYSHSVKGVSFFNSMTWYIENIGFVAMGIVLYLWFAFSLIFFINNEKRKDKFVHLFCILGGISIFTFVFSHVRQIRFIMPVLPSIAVISGWGYEKIKNYKFKIPLLVLIIIYCCAQFYCLTFKSKKMKGGKEGPLEIFGGTYYGDVKHNVNFKIKELIKVISSDTEEEKKVLLVNLARARPYTFEIFYRMKLLEEKIYLLDLVQSSSQNLKEIEMDSVDYIVFKLSDRKYKNKWPDEKILRKKVKKVSFNKYKELILHSWWKDFVNKLYKSKNKFKFFKFIPFYQNCYWSVYKNRD